MKKRIRTLSYLTALMSIMCCIPQVEATDTKEMLSDQVVLNALLSFFENESTSQDRPTTFLQKLKDLNEKFQTLGYLSCLNNNHREAYRKKDNTLEKLRDLCFQWIDQLPLENIESKKEALKTALINNFLQKKQAEKIQTLLDNKLHDATFHGHTEVVQALIGAGADVNAANEKGDTALIGAAANGYDEVAKVLIAADAVIEKQNTWGNNALHWAAINGCVDVVKRLIDAGAVLEKQNIWGKTPLIGAASNGHVEVVKALIDAGVDVNAVNKSRQTPLMLAAANGHDEVVERLIAAGADVHAVDDAGETALGYAASMGHANIVELLQAAAAKQAVTE